MFKWRKSGVVTMSEPDSIKVDQNEETVTEILEPAAELDKKIISPVKETRNQAIRYILWDWSVLRSTLQLSIRCTT